MEREKIQGYFMYYGTHTRTLYYKYFTYGSVSSLKIATRQLRNSVIGHRKSITDNVVHEMHFAKF